MSKHDTGIQVTVGRKELQDIVQTAVDRALEQRQLPGHGDDHEWIRLQKQEWKDRQESWKKFKLSFIGGIALSLVGLLSWIGQAVWELLYNKPGG